MTESWKLTLTEGLSQISEGNLTAEDWTRALFDRIDACESAVHAWAAQDREGALSAARDIDAARSQRLDDGSDHPLDLRISHEQNPSCFEPLTLGGHLGGGTHAEQHPTMREAEELTQRRTSLIAVKIRTARQQLLVDLNSLRHYAGR
ncbi:MAG TPA: hypothetical protein EYQ31_06340 [Candidatus Handelsmanbacteria bacterium]|nr:hypothetical protein [Candidatus Handelsmanbacteria bacterium]